VKILDPLVEALRAAGAPPDSPTRMATVTASDSTGVLVKFDGEADPSTRRYRTVGACRTGDRVLMLRAGMAWVAVGAIGKRAEAVLSSYAEGSIGPAINPNPNDNALRTVFIRTNIITVPAGAHTAVVSMSATAASTVNAACFWTPLFSTNNGVSSWENLLTAQLAHNNTQALVGTGFSVTAEFDVRHIAVGAMCALAVNQSVASGGGSMWLGQCLYRITFRGAAA
jgi:hypothetical protein